MRSINLKFFLFFLLLDLSISTPLIADTDTDNKVIDLTKSNWEYTWGDSPAVETHKWKRIFSRMAVAYDTTAEQLCREISLF